MRLFELRTSLLLCLTASASVAQAPRQYSTEDYARAEKFMPYNTSQLVLHTVANPVWMADGRMWYRDAGANGTTFYVVDPVKGTKTRAFDQEKLATALKALAPKVKSLNVKIDADHLPLREFTLSDGDQTLTTVEAGQKIRCDLSGSGVCTMLGQQLPAAGGGRRRSGGGAETAPDGTKAAFIRDWNLWLRDLKTGKETQLTTDGVKDFGYATDNAGWTHSDNAILVWSPDSKRIATFQQDQRKTGEMYLDER